MTLSLLAMTTGQQACAQEQQPLFLQAEVIASYPHDSNAFTQGLVIENGVMFEGTGRNGESTLRKVNLDTGEVEQRHNIDNAYFGEGITVMNDRIYQLTWKANTGFVYDKQFNLVDTFLYSGEGWGLTDDGESLIMSDGTATLRFLDAETYRVNRRLTVVFQGMPLENLNELEYINGEIWANVWYQDALVRIDPETGVVNSVVDLSALYPERDSRDDVLNGIAWDEDADRLFVTGKLWPALYEIRVMEPASE